MMGYDGYSNNQHISQRTIWAIGLFFEIIGGLWGGGVNITF